MTALAVVEDLNVFEDGGLGLSVCSKAPLVNHLVPLDVIEFKRRKGVIPLAIIGPKMADFHNRNRP